MNEEDRARFVRAKNKYNEFLNSLREEFNLTFSEEVNIVGQELASSSKFAMKEDKRA